MLVEVIHLFIAPMAFILFLLAFAYAEGADGRIRKHTRFLLTSIALSFPVFLLGELYAGRSILGASILFHIPPIFLCTLWVARGKGFSNDRMVLSFVLMGVNLLSYFLGTAIPSSSSRLLDDPFFMRFLMFNTTVVWLVFIWTTDRLFQIVLCALYFFSAPAYLYFGEVRNIDFTAICLLACGMALISLPGFYGSVLHNESTD